MVSVQLEDSNYLGQWTDLHALDKESAGSWHEMQPLLHNSVLTATMNRDAGGFHAAAVVS